MATLWRWCTKGLYIAPLNQVVRLEHIYVGRKIVTTEEWLDQFLERLTVAKTAEHRYRSGRKPDRRYYRIMQLLQAEATLRRARI